MSQNNPIRVSISPEPVSSWPRIPGRTGIRSRRHAAGEADRRRL